MKCKECSPKVRAAIARIAKKNGVSAQDVLNAYVRAANGTAVNRLSLFLK